ncbi:MAG: glycoside hydrolase family 3 C-terminal domain-containing protein [Clostridia bacterium]|nr:glycoside hydrolase family 3 C-terminal domain-containing protein [Clostridia bacterium]MBQ7046560.1 glycoside hydrolase family 3 C-terminal domain-containing protein [Oscillospiraceae bacterium]
MNFNQATEIYKKNPTVENLNKVAKELLTEMTLKEKIRLMQGHAMGVTIKNTLTKGRYYNGEAYPAGGCKRLGIPPVLFTDGPRGIVMKKCTCFPVSMLRGATFDDELEYEVGKVFAREASALNANLFGGVCINLLRNPMWGRAQESYGEDPFLLGKMGVALTKAMQESGIIACPKHYALNSIEDLRFSVDAKADERTLHEVYLPHFKKCIDAGAMSIMGAYNKVNGTYCCENKELLTDILRDKWGFEGFALSDFLYGIYDAARSVKAGMDMEMPYYFRYALLNYKLKKGELTQEDIDLSALRILKALIKTLPEYKSRSKSVILSKEHTQLARYVAGKGTVLLKNENKTLPVESGKKIAVVGRYADKVNVGDHGSSNVYSPYTVTAYEGIKNRFGQSNVTVYNGCDTVKAMQAVKDCEYIVACVGSDWLQEGEFLVNLGNVKKKPKGSGGDRADLRIPREDVELIKALSKTGKKLIVNIMGGSAYVIKEWTDLADSILFSFYSGLEGGNALADVLSGDVNPGGKLPFTIAFNDTDYPPFLHIADKEREIDYGYYHGYTLFDKKSIEPQYPFGYGLSYTDFEISDCSVYKKENVLEVTATVKNIGDADGDEVVQVYVSSENKEEDRPVKLLKGFKRVTVKTGETAVAEISVELDDIKFYDPENGDWKLDKSYVVFVGTDSKNVKAISKVEF